MPPKKATPKAKASASRTTASKAAAASKTSTAQAKSAPTRRAVNKNGKGKEVIEIESDDADAPTTEMDVDSDDNELELAVPAELLTTILHGFYEEDGSRITKLANDTAARYMDVFVQEAVARTTVDKKSGFLEVEDLEKSAPQLLLDV
ncbi:hypothetical protein OQA88_11214 [Cercophora sp. LCS_1]